MPKAPAFISVSNLRLYGHHSPSRQPSPQYINTYPFGYSPVHEQSNPQYSHATHTNEARPIPALDDHFSKDINDAKAAILQKIRVRDISKIVSYSCNLFNQIKSSFEDYRIKLDAKYPRNTPDRQRYNIWRERSTVELTEFAIFCDYYAIAENQINNRCKNDQGEFYGFIPESLKNAWKYYLRMRRLARSRFEPELFEVNSICKSISPVLLATIINNTLAEFESFIEEQKNQVKAIISSSEYEYCQKESSIRLLCNKASSLFKLKFLYIFLSYGDQGILKYTNHEMFLLAMLCNHRQTAKHYLQFVGEFRPEELEETINRILAEDTKFYLERNNVEYVIETSKAPLHVLSRLREMQLARQIEQIETGETANWDFTLEDMCSISWQKYDELKREHNQIKRYVNRT